MNKRNVLFLGIIAGLLVVSAYFVLTPSSSEVSGGSLLGKKFNAESISSISLSQATSTLELMLDGEIWKSGDTDVDATKVNEFLDALESDTIVSVVSNNKENAVNFGVDDITGKTITLKSEKDTYEIVFGSVAQQFGRYYARGLHSDETVIANGRANQLFSHELDPWLSLEEETIESVSDFN